MIKIIRYNIYSKFQLHCLVLVFSSCAKMPREKQLEGERAYVAHSPRFQLIIAIEFKGTET